MVAASVSNPGSEQQRQDDCAPMRAGVAADYATGSAFADPERSAFCAERSEDPLVSSPISQKTVFEVYPATLKVKRPFNGESPVPPDRQGQTLKGFSDKSRSRLRFTAANSADLLRSQFCCTYHDLWPIDGREFKRHLNLFLTRCRQTFPFLEYLWVAEFQTRGAPHAHVYLSLPADQETRDTLARIWCRIVDKNDQALLAFHRHPKNMITWEMRTGSYLCKYLDKEHQKAIPDGFRNFGRWWGNSRSLVPDPDQITDEDLAEEFPQVDQETGEIHEQDAFKFLIRTVGRYHEKKNKRSWFRKTSRSTSALTGADIFRQSLNYLRRTRGTKNEPIPF